MKESATSGQTTRAWKTARHALAIAEGVQSTTPKLVGKTTASLSPNVLANASEDLTAGVTGSEPGDLVLVSPEASIGALGIGYARVSAPGTVTITFINPTVAPIAPGATTFDIMVLR